MKRPWHISISLPVLALSGFLLTNCRMDRPTIDDNGSGLSQVAIGSLKKPSWTAFDLKLERLKPTAESVNKSYQKPASDGDTSDVAVKVVYGTYRIALSYRDAQNKVIYESCPTEKSKEHLVNAPKYATQIQICEVGGTAPIDVVQSSEANVSITPVVVAVPTPAAGSFVEQHGLLTASGGKLLDKNKQVIQLKGMSLFWSQWASGFYSKEVVTTLKNDWKATLVRAAMGVEEGGYLTQGAAEKERVKAVVNAATAEGIYVIIDWHDHNATQHTAQAVEFFSEMAGLYGNSPNVIFEVFNEPTSVSWDAVKSYAETVIKAIRAKGAKNLVIVGSPTWSQDVDKAADNPIVDSNVAYTLHFYSGSHRQPLRDKATYAISKGLTLFVTEFGVCDASGNGGIDLAEADLWFEFMNKNKISWANWSLFDKQESASALKPGVNPRSVWAVSDLTESGAYIKKKLLQ